MIDPNKTLAKFENRFIADLISENAQLRAECGELREFVRSMTRRKVHMGWAMWRYETTLDLDDARNATWEWAHDERPAALSQQKRGDCDV